MGTAWIESSAKGRHGGPVRSGRWATVVVGTSVPGPDQEIWLEVQADDGLVSLLRGFWMRDQGPNSLWHVPVPPQPVGSRLRCRAGVGPAGSIEFGPPQDVTVRPNPPGRGESADIALPFPEGLVGNRQMTARVDARGTTYDVFFPTVGMHAQVRPAEGDQFSSRVHFRAIAGGLAVGPRIDWFSEREHWTSTQDYLGATMLLATDLRWRHGPIRVRVTDLIADGPSCPVNATGLSSPGQYLKRYRLINEGEAPCRALFGVYIHAEVNGGIGEPGLFWIDEDRAILAFNRGHGHSNPKLARDATVEFGVALDNRGEAWCEPTGPNESLLLRWVDLPANGEVRVDLLVSGAFTSWRSDPGTYEHWLRPALRWFRAANVDAIEDATAAASDPVVDAIPETALGRPTPAPPARPTVLDRPALSAQLRRSILSASAAQDAQYGAFASGFESGLDAYCSPRVAMLTAGALLRAGQPRVVPPLCDWLARVQARPGPFQYWAHKYTIDGVPEWESPAVDHSALVPWLVERHWRATGDLSIASRVWREVTRAAGVCLGDSGHPGMAWIGEIRLLSSVDWMNRRYGAFLAQNASAVVGLRAAADLAEALGKGELAAAWRGRAGLILEEGILGEGEEFGLSDPELGFLDGRRVSKVPLQWTDDPALLVDRSGAARVSILRLALLGLLPADDPRLVRVAERLRACCWRKDHPRLPPAVARWDVSATAPGREGASVTDELSCWATLEMARYLIALGRATGSAREWDDALMLMEGILQRLGPLGVNLRPLPRVGGDELRVGRLLDRDLRGLHGLLIDALLDWTGLSYDAAEGSARLAPALPSSWPGVGQSQAFPCGRISYSLERGDARAPWRLRLDADLDRGIRLDADIACPGLRELSGWSGPASPRFEPARGGISWSMELPAGDSRLEWSWGGAGAPASDNGSASPAASHQPSTEQP